jgi:hypothetical protein
MGTAAMVAMLGDSNIPDSMQPVEKRNGLKSNMYM